MSEADIRPEFRDRLVFTTPIAAEIGSVALGVAVYNQQAGDTPEYAVEMVRVIDPGKGIWRADDQELANMSKPRPDRPTATLRHMGPEIWQMLLDAVRNGEFEGDVLQSNIQTLTYNE